MRGSDVAHDPENEDAVEELRARTTLFCGVVAFAIALSMLLRGRRRVHWLFAAFAVQLAAWYTSQSLADLLQSEIYKRATAALTVLLPQFAVHLFQAIIPLEIGANEQSRLRRASAFLGAPMLVLALSPYHKHPVSLTLVYLYVFGLLAAALVSLWLRGQRSPSRAVRDRVRFLVAVGGLAMTFTLADFLSYLGLYLPPIGAVLAIVFLFVLAESVTRPRLADLYELVGRLIVSTALAFALAGIFYGFIMYLGRYGAMYFNATLAAIVFLVLFEPLENMVRTRTHQFFFRERYDLETSVTNLKRRLAHALEVDEMVDTLLSGLEKSRRITSCAVYLFDGENGFDLAGSIGGAAPKRLESSAVRPILDHLDRSLSLEEAARDPEARGNKNATILAAAANLGDLKTAVVLAIRGENEDLVGIVCIADDRVKDAFTPEEIVLLETVAAQLGVALANSRVYARMKERDRLAALGSMAAGLAHEVKNPLGAIKGAAQLLEESAADPSAREFIGIILEETDRLNRVVGSFLDYARPNSGDPAPLDANATVRRTAQILESQQLEGIEIVLELGDDLPRVKIDPEQLRQVIINFVQNAVQAMNGHGTVTISTSHRKVARAALGAPPPSDRVSGPQRVDTIDVVDVSVRDTGPGIAPKVLKNLFVPFFTTKDQGTGLGLAISQRIVQNVGGTIDVQTQSGAGTKFTIVLPATSETPFTPAPPEAEPKAKIEDAAG